jgi:hypothetical protein
LIDRPPDPPTINHYVYYTRSVNPPPLRATDDLVSKLERAHHCTQQLRASASSHAGTKREGEAGNGGFVLVPAYVPVGLDAPIAAATGAAAGGGGGGGGGNGKRIHQHAHAHPPQFGEESEGEEATSHPSGAHAHAPHEPGLQEHINELIHQNFKFRLHRLPSTVPGAGLGLFLTSGKVEEGAVLTCYPGLIYRIPYDLESEMGMDEVSFTPCPPGESGSKGGV